MRLLVIRHAPTEWNAAGRLQGRRDVPLSEDGARTAAGWRLPAFAAGWPCLSSPLRRCLDTARAMGLAPTPDPAFVEMDWGDLEGRPLAEARAAGGDGFARAEAMGLDFRPPGGETPAEVLDRVTARLGRLIADDGVIVSHKGIIRALLAGATGWDMTGKPPVRLVPGTGQLFRFAAGRLSLLEANMALEHSAPKVKNLGDETMLRPLEPGAPVRRVGD